MWYASFGGVSGRALAALERAGAFGLTGRRRPRPEGAQHADGIDPSDSAGCAPGPAGVAPRCGPLVADRLGERRRAACNACLVRQERSPRRCGYTYLVVTPRDGRILKGFTP